MLRTSNLSSFKFFQSALLVLRFSAPLSFKVPVKRTFKPLINLFCRFYYYHIQSLKFTTYILRPSWCLLTSLSSSISRAFPDPDGDGRSGRRQKAVVVQAFGYVGSISKTPFKTASQSGLLHLVLALLVLDSLVTPVPSQLKPNGHRRSIVCSIIRVSAILILFHMLVVFCFLRY